MRTKVVVPIQGRVTLTKSSVHSGSRYSVALFFYQIFLTIDVGFLCGSCFPVTHFEFVATKDKLLLRIGLECRFVRLSIRS